MLSFKLENELIMLVISLERKRESEEWIDSLCIHEELNNFNRNAK